MADEFIQDPDDNLDYIFDWSAWLDGDTITDSAMDVTPAGLDITSTPDQFTAINSTVWATGGTHGQSYKISNEITTSGGRKRTRSIIIRVKEQQI